MSSEPENASDAGRWMKAERLRRGWSGQDLADRVNGIARESGDPTEVSQQVLSKFEQAKSKRKPAWVRHVAAAFDADAGETKNDPHLHTGKTDTSVGIRLLPTFAGMGSGGTGDGDEGLISFSRDLIENELRTPPDALLAMVAEGNSMEPDFKGGDQILVDTRRKTLAQPGAFCLWDGDGHVIKFLQKVPGSDPAQVRIISANGVYEPETRLLDEINLVGRVVWYGRRVQ